MKCFTDWQSLVLLTKHCFSLPSFPPCLPPSSPSSLADVGVSAVYLFFQVQAAAPIEAGYMCVWDRVSLCVYICVSGCIYLLSVCEHLYVSDWKECVSLWECVVVYIFSVCVCVSLFDARCCIGQLVCSLACICCIRYLAGVTVHYTVCDALNSSIVFCCIGYLYSPFSISAPGLPSASMYLHYGRMLQGVHAASSIWGFLHLTPAASSSPLLLE